VWGSGDPLFALAQGVRSLENRLIFRGFAANPLPTLSGFIGFYWVLTGSMSANENREKKLAEPLFMRFPSQ